MKIGNYFINFNHPTVKTGKRIYVKGLEKLYKEETQRKTVCKIYEDTQPLKEPLAVAEAICSVSDNFNKEIGRQISLERAMDLLFEKKKEELKEAYINR